MSLQLQNYSSRETEGSAMWCGERYVEKIDCGRNGDVGMRRMSILPACKLFQSDKEDRQITMPMVNCQEGEI